MPAGAFMLILIFGFLGFLGVFMAASYLAQRGRGLSRAEKRELENLRRLVETIDNIAYENRDIDPMTSPMILDEIKKARKELR